MFSAENDFPMALALSSVLSKRSLAAIKQVFGVQVPSQNSAPVVFKLLANSSSRLDMS
jgi:hypothetical protein